MEGSRTTAGSAYYSTAVALRADARAARTSYPKALERVRGTQGPPHDEAVLHAEALIVQAVGYEIAAALCMVAQAIQDASG